MSHTEEGCANGVRVLSRRMVRPLSPTVAANGGHPPEQEAEEIHLTPWDLRVLNIIHIQRGIVLLKPPATGDDLAETLASSFARALGQFYIFAGRLAAEKRSDGTVTVSLRCTGEGAEFVHATAPRVAVADLVTSLCTPPVVYSFFPFNKVLGVHAVLESLPVLAAQVTELADGVFIAMSMNHSVGDGTAFWELFNTWSQINRGGNGIGDDYLLRDQASMPVFQRWFVDTSPVPIPMPFSKLQHLVSQRFENPVVQQCFFTFSATSVMKLKERANHEMASIRATAGATISSLQALLAHLWRAICRARRIPPEQHTFYIVMVGCRGRVTGIPPAGYVGNAVVPSKAEATAGEIEKNGLGWTAWQLNRAVASFDDARLRDWLHSWALEPHFPDVAMLASSSVALFTGSSPRFDVFGNDFGWGKPLAVRSGKTNNMDGIATVFEGPDKGGGISVEVNIRADVLARLVADEEFMEAVSLPLPT